MEVFKDKILITGAAGFIGAALSKRLILEGYKVIGIDNLNMYYDKKLKLDRLEEIKKNVNVKFNNWKFEKLSLEDKNQLEEIFIKYYPTIVINLAAQAGVRYSIENPRSYLNSNVVGFFNLLDCCRRFNIKNLIYSSSSSVYGGNKNLPFSEDNAVDHPMSFYAATKKSNELMAHSFSHIYGIPTTGLRLFTVYGPWGRPDMAPMIFTKSIFERKPIEIYNFGNMKRDFTYIDDVVECIFRICSKPAQSDKNFNLYNPSPSLSFAPYRIFNVGNSQSVSLLNFIKTLESAIGIKAIKTFKEIQPGDVEETSSNNSKLLDQIKFCPNTSLKKGVSYLIKWYKEYYLK